ncbi:MAG: SUMF1/EgtB/PvdO family nonheme iron enzyme [Rhizonema sp. PD37]|nr:SUMF1/EgtB/PvdO family nonheme iron enzyme [Rhizonema sp. PD37]
MKSILDMVLIPEGSFLMGADEDSSQYEEQPQREVWLSTYAIQRTPVTVGQWQEFLRETAYDWSYDDETLSRNRKILGATAHDFDWILPNQATKVSPTESYPIVFVSWFDACQFTKWLKETLGGAYALPTDAQWEKACRGQNGQLYPWGNLEVDWDEEMALHSDTKTNQPVGFCPERQSPYGCLDMWQNVSEWCSDCHDSTESYYHDPNTPRVNPPGPATGEYRICRGGNLLSSGWPRCTYRDYRSPHCYDPGIGFRIVLNY